MAKLLRFIKTKPLFPLLLCLFFVLHGFTENYDFVPSKDALFLFGIYVLFTLVIGGLSWFFYRDITKAALFAFFIMSFHFFFGAAHDLLKNVFGVSFITRYSFILPVSAIFFLLITIFLKKSRKTFVKFSAFLNILFILLVLFDLGSLLSKMLSDKKKNSLLPPEFTLIDKTSRPDIYLIVADEYAGNTELKEIFQFDNTAFEDSLRNKGFHVIPYGKSNYNYTPFAGASLLHMNYLQLENKERGQTDLAYSYKIIKENNLLNFLQQQGYQFYNYSVFDFTGQPRRINEGFLPVKTRLITSQTFLSRLEKDLRFNLITRFRSRSELKRLTYGTLHNNNNIYELTWNIAEERTGKPKFVYTHLMMPHYPYYFDKNGKEQPFEKLTEGNQSNQQAYIEYLQYCNKKFLSLSDHILISSTEPPIIVLMGDHGFRHFKQPVKEEYYFFNHASVHLPSQNYSAFPDSMTSVNLFRIILNTEFQQHLPLLKDSTIYLKD
jgi:hypothetical protein